MCLSSSREVQVHKFILLISFFPRISLYPSSLSSSVPFILFVSPYPPVIYRLPAIFFSSFPFLSHVFLLSPIFHPSPCFLFLTSSSSSSPHCFLSTASLFNLPILTLSSPSRLLVLQCFSPVHLYLLLFLSSSHPPSPFLLVTSSSSSTDLCSN